MKINKVLIETIRRVVRLSSEYQHHPKMLSGRFAHMTVGMIAATLTSETPVVHVVQPRLLAPPTTNSWTPTPAGKIAGDFSV